MKLSINLKKVLYYFISLSFILSGHCIYKYIVEFSFLNTVFKYFVIIICVIGILTTFPRKIDNRYILFLALLLLYTTIYIVVSGKSVFSYIIDFMVYVLLFYTLAFNLLKIKKFGELLKTYKNIILIISAVSFFIWLLGPITGVISPTNHYVYYWGEHYWQTNSYFGIYFDNPTQTQSFFGLFINRNCGIFTEGTGFAEYLLYAFLIEKYVCYEDKGHKKNLLILFLTMLSTQSTKIFLLLIILHVVEYILNTGIKNRYSLVKQISLGSIMIVISYWAINTIIDDKSQSDSFISRMSDIIAGYNAFINNPIVGVGYRNYDAINSFNTFNKFSSGVTMGITALIAQGGIYLTALYIIPAIYLVCITQGQLKKNLIICIIALILNLFISNAAFTNPYLFVLAAMIAFISLKYRTRMEGKGC